MRLPRTFIEAVHHRAPNMNTTLNVVHAEILLCVRKHALHIRQPIPIAPHAEPRAEHPREIPERASILETWHLALRMVATPSNYNSSEHMRCVAHRTVFHVVMQPQDRLKTGQTFHYIVQPIGTCFRFFGGR